MRNHSLKPLWLLAIVAVAVGGLSACAGAPPGVDPAIPRAFERAWAGAPPGAISYMERVVIPRESGWDPCSFNPRQSNCSVWNPGTAKGLLQLLGHDDLIFQACPNPWGIIAWQDPYCNARAGFFLSGGGHNLSPWRGPFFAATHTGPEPTGVLVVLRMPARSSSRDGLTGKSGAVQDDVNRWIFVTASNYAQSLIDAQAVGAEDARWAATHACEEGGQGWYAAGSTRDGTFHGGLGISVQAWAENSAGFPPDALDATQYQQELVADRILARYGHSAWSCPTPPVG